MNAKQTVKKLAAVADRLAPPPAGSTILIYHRVGGGSDSDVDLPLDDFERQLEHLVNAHRVVTLDQAVGELSDGCGDVTPSVALTFDDGTADFCDVVVPALVRHGVPATLYVATQFVDEATPFPWGAPPTSWSALRDAAATGLVTIGSHTHTHGLLHHMPTDEVVADLDRSIDLIGSHLGRAPEHFAYPKAVPGSAAAEIEVRRRFRSAALAGGQVNRPGDCDVHRLGRVPIQCSDTFEQFAAKSSGGLRLEGRLRSAIASVRYRSSTQ